LYYFIDGKNSNVSVNFAANPPNLANPLLFESDCRLRALFHLCSFAFRTNFKEIQSRMERKAPRLIIGVPLFFSFDFTLSHRLSTFRLWHVFCLVSQINSNFFSGDSKTFFNSKECVETPRNVHVFNIIIGASYLFVDTFVCLAQIRNR
jgi:hypothetical protein